MSVYAERAVRQLERLLNLDTHGNPMDPPEDFATTIDEDIKIADITFLPDQRKVIIRRVDTNKEIIE